MKKCRKCLETKQFGDFYKYARGRFGVMAECIVCKNKRSANDYRKNHLPPVKLTEDEVVSRRKARFKVWLSKNSAWISAKCADRRARKLSHRPKWANRFFISEIYSLARLRSKMLGVKFHVDHVVPLKSPIVCGLHYEQNLEIIPALANSAKGNRCWPDMPENANLGITS